MPFKFKATNSDQMPLYLKGSPSWKFAMKLETRESPICCRQHSQEKKATETIVRFKQKDYCGSRTVSAFILSEGKIHEKAAKQKTKKKKRGWGELKKSDERK